MSSPCLMNGVQDLGEAIPLRDGGQPLPPRTPEVCSPCPRRPSVAFSALGTTGFLTVALRLLAALSQCPFNLKLCFSKQEIFLEFSAVIPCPTPPLHTG